MTGAQDMRMMLKSLVVILLIGATRANTVTLTRGETCGHSGGISSFSYQGRTYVCKDECPRAYEAINGTSVYNGTSLFGSTFNLGVFACPIVESPSPLTTRFGNIGCYLVLTNDQVSTVSAWSFHVQLTTDTGVLMSSAYGDVVLSTGNVFVRSPVGDDSDLGQDIELNKKYHFIVLIRRGVRNVYVDVYIDGVHTGSTTTYSAPSNSGQSTYDVSFGGCDVCGSSSERSLIGEITDIRKFEEGLTDREARALFSATLPEVTPSPSCLCPPSHPYDVTSSDGASASCAQTSEQGQAPADLVSRFYDVANGGYFTDVSFLSDGMTSFFVQGQQLLPAIWISESGPVTLTVNFVEPSTIKAIEIFTLSGVPADGIFIYKEPSHTLLHLVGDCSMASVQAMAYDVDDATCTDSSTVLPGSPKMVWSSLNRPGVNPTMMTSSARQHLTAEGLTIELRGSQMHVISEVMVDASPLIEDLCQCYVDKSKTCTCSCDAENANDNLAKYSCEPEITNIRPEMGRLSGGDSLTITGNNLLPGVTEVLIGSTPCSIQSSDENEIVCETAGVSSEMPDQPVKITLENGVFIYAKERFHYRELPAITSIEPTNILDSGVSVVTVTGRNLDVPGARIAIQKQLAKMTTTSVAEPCTSQSATTLICPTPSINATGFQTNDGGAYNSGDRLKMGVVWPDLGGFENVAAVSALGLSTTEPKVYAAPKIEFEGGTAVFRAFETDEFIFEGENLLSDMVREEDYEVRVGGKVMEDIVEVTDTMLKVKLPKEQPEAENPAEDERNTLSRAQVVIAGVTTLTPGYIKWFKTIWDDVAARIGILCAVFAVLMVLLVIALTVLANRKKKKELEEKKLLNNNYEDIAAPPMPTKSPIEDHLSVPVTNEKVINLVDSEYLKKLEMCLVTESDRLTRSGAHVRGNFGEIVHGEFGMPQQPTRDLVYIKIVRDSSRASKKSDLESHVAKVDGYLKSAGVLADLVHPNTQALLALAFSGSQVYFVYPRCKATDLKFYLRHPDVQCTVASLIGVINDIAKGMKYLHTQDIIHSDVAARNCVVTESNTVAISDSVLSDDFYPEDYSQPLGGTANNVYPIRWMSPRYLTSGNCSFFGDDIYAFSITMWEVITRCQFPYADMTNQAVLDEVPHGMRPQQPHHCPDELFNLMTACWSPDFKARPSFEFIVNTLATVGNSQAANGDMVIELVSRSPPEVFHQEVMAPHVTLANSGGAYFNLAFKNDSNVTTNM